MSLTKYFKCFSVFIFAISFAFADFIENSELKENPTSWEILEKNSLSGYSALTSAFDAPTPD